MANRRTDAGRTMASTLWSVRLAALLLGFSLGCAPSELGGRSRGDTGRAKIPTSDTNGSVVDDGDDSLDGTVKKKKKKKKSNSNDDEDKDDEGDEDDDLEEAKPSTSEPRDFPKLRFSGQGHTTYKLKDRLPIRQRIETDLDERRLVLTTTEGRVECGSVDGCKQKDLDRDVNPAMSGAQTYNRPTKTALEKLIKGGFQKASFAIFAKDARSKSGTLFTFDKPIPVYFWPVAVSRFEPLDDGSMSWSARVTAERYLTTNPNLSDDVVQRGDAGLVTTGQILREFTANVSVSKVSRSGKTIVVRLDVDIPEDRNSGLLYRAFPLPKSATYTIDTDEQVILKVESLSWGSGDRSKQREESRINFALCAKVSSGDTKNFDCP